MHVTYISTNQWTVI